MKQYTEEIYTKFSRNLGSQIFSSRAMSKVVNMKIYKTKVRPVVVYGSEIWAMFAMSKKRLGTWERIIRIKKDMWKQWYSKEMENKK